MPGAVQTLTCPLCAHGDARVIEGLTGAELRRLWQAMGREFTAPAWGKIGPDSVIELRRCQHCGFEFFDPSLAGNEIFYRELEHAEYFVENRPEFARTLDFARERGLKRILDVGCGSGIFLDLARAAGAETFGLELNRAAADKAQTKGHKVFNQLLGELPPDANGFDLITFFQVLEHVPEPVTLMREAAARLRPGGFIAVAVPSADGVFRLVPRDPHQWPPHHMSRWRLRDFQLLARTTGLELIESGGDNLLGSEINHFWNVHNQLAPAVGKPKRAGSPAIVSLLSFLYRKTGMKFLFPHWGSSIYACFKRTG